MAIYPFIIAPFDKFKVWHTKESKQDGLDPIFVRLDMFFPPGHAERGVKFSDIRFGYSDIYANLC